MLFTTILAAFSVSLSSQPQTQSYSLSLPNAIGQIDILVPFGKVIENQSYILRVCSKDENLINSLKVVLDGKVGSEVSGFSGCKIVDWPVALKLGEHSVSIELPETSEQTSYSFTVVPGDKKEFGIVGASRYIDWSILRPSEHKGVFNICSLSTSHAVRSIVKDIDSQKTIANPQMLPHATDNNCVMVSNLNWDSYDKDIAELHVFLTSQHSVVFPITRGQFE